VAAPTALRAVEREMRVFATLWRANIFGVFLAPILTLAALGIGLGGLVERDLSELGGLEYIEFITPGLMVAAAVQTAAGGSLWPVMAGHRWIGFHYAEVASPMSAGDVYDGQVLWVGVRAALQSFAFLLAGVAFGGIGSIWGIAAIPIAMATSLAFAAPLAAFAATQDSDVSFDILLRIVVVPLYLFSGTVFPIEQLPIGLRVVVEIFPLAHGVELARAASTGSADFLAVVGHAAVIAAYICAGWIWGRRAFANRLTA
jgi:lipooligosaccharide transport system permease protein